MAVIDAMRAGLRATLKGVEYSPDAKVEIAARPEVTLVVIEQKSADGIVAQCPS